MEETHDLLELFGLDMPLDEERTTEIISILGKITRLFILHDPTIGVADIDLKILGARIARWVYKQPCDLEISNAINQVRNMPDDHCEERDCFRDCNYWRRCPLAIISKGPMIKLTVL